MERVVIVIKDKHEVALERFVFEFQTVLDPPPTWQRDVRRVSSLVHTFFNSRRAYIHLIASKVLLLPRYFHSTSDLSSFDSVSLKIDLDCSAQQVRINGISPCH